MPDTVEIGGIEQRAGARIERAERRDADAGDRPVGPLQQTAAQAREQLGKPRTVKRVVIAGRFACDNLRGQVGEDRLAPPPADGDPADER